MAVQSAYRDAETVNDSNRDAQIYKDLNLNFTKHPIRKDVTPLTGAAAVKRSVRNLVQYGHFEKPFHPEIGSNLRGMLFENITPQMSHAIQKEISLLLQNFIREKESRRGGGDLTIHDCSDICILSFAIAI